MHNRHRLSSCHKGNKSTRFLGWFPGTSKRRGSNSFLWEHALPNCWLKGCSEDPIPTDTNLNELQVGLTGTNYLTVSHTAAAGPAAVSANSASKICFSFSLSNCAKFLSIRTFATVLKTMDGFYLAMLFIPSSALKRLYIRESYQTIAETVCKMDKAGNTWNWKVAVPHIPHVEAGQRSTVTPYKQQQRMRSAKRQTRFRSPIAGFDALDAVLATVSSTMLLRRGHAFSSTFSSSTKGKRRAPQHGEDKARPQNAMTFMSWWMRREMD